MPYRFLLRTVVPALFFPRFRCLLLSIFVSPRASGAVPRGSGEPDGRRHGPARSGYGSAAFHGPAENGPARAAPPDMPHALRLRIVRAGGELTAAAPGFPGGGELTAAAPECPGGCHLGADVVR